MHTLNTTYAGPVLLSVPSPSRAHQTQPTRRLAWQIALVGALVAMLAGLLGPVPASDARPAGNTASTANTAAPKDPSQDLPAIPKRCSKGYPYINPDIRPCKVNRFKPNRPTVVLWGDSHALQMLPAVRKAVAGRRVNLAMFALGSCPPLMYHKAGKRAKVACKRFNADALKYVTKLQRKGKRVRVILGSHWQAYRWLHRGLFKNKSLKRSDYPGYVVEAGRVFPKRAPALMRRLGRLGVGVDVIGQTATVPVKGLRRCSAGEKPFVCSLPRPKALPEERSTAAWLSRSMRPLARDARLIDPNTAYCNRKRCKGKKNGIYTFFNDLHISATRAATMRGYFLPSVKRLKRQKRRR